MAEVEYWQPGEEAEFLDFCRTAEKWNWQWAVWTRGDINSRLDRNITDEEWELVAENSRWDSLGNYMNDVGSELVGDVVGEVFPEEE